MKVHINIVLNILRRIIGCMGRGKIADYSGPVKQNMKN